MTEQEVNQTDVGDVVQEVGVRASTFTRGHAGFFIHFMTEPKRTRNINAAGPERVRKTV